ncbi:MAG: YbaB/EbfC family nucleoid-associated protein [Mariprofundales bacterium]|nr:YbaB/EbfC family nucleoid-associated protein [Mariprofundales bacterium]
MNIGKMMQQAQALQERMKNMQEEIANIEVSGEAGGGMVTVVMRGDYQVRSITIDESVWQEQDRAMLEDLIAAATNAASQQIASTIKDRQGAMLSGIPLPPGFSL